MSIHATRRASLRQKLGPGLVLVRGEGPSTGSANLRYLTGIDESQAILLLADEPVRVMTGRNYPGPDYVRGREALAVLFLPRSDSMAARWGEDAAATVEGVRSEDLEVDAVLGLDELDAVLSPALRRADRLHYVRAVEPILGGADDPDSRFVARLRHRFFGLQVLDATSVVHEQRRVKDAGEIAAIERSAALTADAFDHLLSEVGAGVSESALEARLAATYRASGGRYAFDPIVASGRNALRLHYKQNAGATAAGDLLLVDSGVRLDGYCSDVTRTFPVDGRFAPRQRRVYDTVLRAQREAIALCRPGGTLAEVHARAWSVIDDAGFGGAFPHGTSHHIGLETHDVGDVHRPLCPGCVITVEPGIYIEDEGIGVRIEDDVLITADGQRVLTEAIPSTIEQIEERMS